MSWNNDCWSSKKNHCCDDWSKSKDKHHCDDDKFTYIIYIIFVIVSYVN